MQKYCGNCSERSDLQRKKVVAKERAGRSLGKEIGAAISLDKARTIGFARPCPDLLWIARISVPFSYAASKNHIYSLVASGHVRLRKNSKAIKDLITAEFTRALAGQRVAHNKVWIDILVQKSNHKGDAINVIDLVCDGIKRALPVDDRWFCIRSLDWEVVRDGGYIFIGIGQDTKEDAQVCSYCGQIKTLKHFHPAANKHLGFGRECRTCLKAIRVARKERLVA